MKTTMFWAATLCIAITGCQSTQGVSPSAGYDLDKMARVEEAARSSGVKVYWINPPYLARTENAKN